MFAQISVYPNHTGFLFRRNKRERQLEPGVYRFFDPFREIKVVNLPVLNRLLTITNQEVLTNDNLALRFSFVLEYRIVDPVHVVDSVGLHLSQSRVMQPDLATLDSLVTQLAQSASRKMVAATSAQELNQHREDLFQPVREDLMGQLSQRGLALEQIFVRDITFPKAVLDLFVRQLEAKIRAQADLENARTTVAAARALKNAADIGAGDPNVRFLQFIETLLKISEKGKHTFVLGDNPIHWP
jgi:regulator of protease activity HflC (stomatin/prohibitin superfamily)